jgi:hypothetical protein
MGRGLGGRGGVSNIRERDKREMEYVVYGKNTYPPSPTGTGKHDNVPTIIVNYRFIVGN